jgi:ubiquinone/menaquinone biosynthesis C-methylase UbiE
MSISQSFDRKKKEETSPTVSPSRTEIIRAVTHPLAFFTLVVLIAEAVSALILTQQHNLSSNAQAVLIYGMVGVIFLLVGVVAGMAVFRPEALYKPRRNKVFETETTREIVAMRLEKSAPIAFEDHAPPSVGVWYEEIRPVLHQAIQYTVPTYYLDVNLMVVDWNIAFDLVFSRLGAILRGKHVKWFIAELQNFDEVMDHAQKFTRQVLEGRIPFVDVEPLQYSSEKYGPVSFLKVAAQLHDADGRPRGWSVSLIIHEIDWESFEKDLLEETRKDKLWSVYAASYDRVLLQYAPYKQLIQDVIAVVPSGKGSVVDLGAGTGNVTAALLAAGHVVTAVENNLGMLDRLRSKHLSGRKPTVVKSSIENLTTLADKSFDAAMMVNVLYAVDDPLACLQEVHRILKPNGVLGLSTTHSESELDTLLNSIRAQLQETGKYRDLVVDYHILRDVNKQIEKVMAKRHTREKYREWVRTAGFEIIKEVPSTYEEAVMLIHARKR